MVSVNDSSPALIRYASGEDGVSRFAVVADASGADYVWPDEENAWFGDDRLVQLLEDQDPPSTPEDWMDLAYTGLYEFSYPEDVPAPNLQQGIKIATQRLAAAVGEGETDTSYSAAAAAGSRAFNEVSEDYPDLGTGVDEEDPEGMNHFVLQALGPIDPEGPNGWILRAMDGEPRPGDENMFVNFSPGAVVIAPPEESAEQT